MKKNIFEYNNYKTYLSDYMEAQPGRGRGFRSKLAKAIGSQRALVSQVLQGEAHFSLEHGERIQQFLGFNSEEARYFHLLLGLARAGTTALADFYREQLQDILKNRLLLKNRIKAETKISFEDSLRYYSSWIYGAIRIATGVPQLQTKEAIAKRLHINEKKVKEVLDFLVNCGLVEQKGSEYHSSSNFTNVGDDSALVTKHHANWRVRALSSFDQEGARDIHYSSVVSLSKQDALRIKSILVNQVEQVNQIVRESPEETICSFCLDFFEL